MVDAMSKPPAAERANHDAAIPGLEPMDEDQAYPGRWISWSKPNAQAAVQKAVFFAVADLQNLAVSFRVDPDRPTGVSSDPGCAASLCCDLGRG
jgi:hypothetical protein